MRLVPGSSLSPSQFFAQLFIIFWKKEVTDPGFESWSSAFERIDLSIALLEVSLRICIPLITYSMWTEVSLYSHVFSSSPSSSKFLGGGQRRHSTCRGWEQGSSDLFTLLDSKHQNQLNVSHSHNWVRSLVVISTLFEARGLGFESPGMHHFFKWGVHALGKLAMTWRPSEVALAWQCGET
jgi:hypothetical protein